MGGLHDLVRLLLQRQEQPLVRVHRLQYHRWQMDQGDVESDMAPDNHCEESRHGSQREVVPPVRGCLGVHKVGGVQGSIAPGVQPTQQVEEVEVAEHCRNQHVGRS